MYEALGGVPAIEEVRFSVIHNRGCFGGCNFCALAFHQGRMVTSRSHESVIREVEAMTRHPLWKGYVSDVGGPSANFRHPSCKKQLKSGMCANRSCLAPTPCPNIDADHSDYLALLRKLRKMPGVKKVFVRSGIRYDYMLCDKSGRLLLRAGALPHLRPAQGRAGALHRLGARLHGQAAHRRLRALHGRVPQAQPALSTRSSTSCPTS